MTLLALPLALTLLTGCAKTVVLHPIEDSDIKLLSMGDNFSAPKQGMFLSDFYVAEVMKARVE